MAETLTVRVIQNFTAGIVKYVVLTDLPATTTFADVATRVQAVIDTDDKLKRLRGKALDSFKLYHVPGGFKSSNRTFNIETSDPIIPASSETTLADAKVPNEAELSFFNNKELAVYENRGMIHIGGMDAVHAASH